MGECERRARRAFFFFILFVNNRKRKYARTEIFDECPTVTIELVTDTGRERLVFAYNQISSVARRTILPIFDVRLRFELGSKAPQAFRISKLPHPGISRYSGKRNPL